MWIQVPWYSAISMISPWHHNSSLFSLPFSTQVHFSKSDLEQQFWVLLLSSFTDSVHMKKRLGQNWRLEIRCSQLSTQLMPLNTCWHFLREDVKAHFLQPYEILLFALWGSLAANSPHHHHTTRAWSISMESYLVFQTRAGSLELIPTPRIIPAKPNSLLAACETRALGYQRKRNSTSNALLLSSLLSKEADVERALHGRAGSERCPPQPSPLWAFQPSALTSPSPAASVPARLLCVSLTSAFRALQTQPKNQFTHLSSLNSFQIPS